MITEGMTLREALMPVKEKGLPIHYLLDYKGKKIRGLTAIGINIWFPKKYRAQEAELEIKVLKDLVLKRMDGEEFQFFLIPLRIPKIISSGVIDEKMVFKDALKKAKDNNYPIETIVKESIIRGFRLGGVTVWIPKSLRKTSEEINLDQIKSLTLKKWEMENRQVSFLLVS